MTQLTFPSPYSLVLPIQVKTPGEPSSLHLDSFLLSPRERSCRFTGELPNDSLTSHLRSKWMRRKASACLQPGTNMKSPGSVGTSNPHSCSSQQMWQDQNPGWSYCGGGSMGPITKVWRCYSSAVGPRVRWRSGHGWFLEAWEKAWCFTLYSSPLWIDLDGFSSGVLAAKALISSLKRFINNQQGGWQVGFIL